MSAELAPLAERMRPRSLEEVVGHPQLTAPDSSLRRALAAGVPHSLVLWGPPGSGKTTIAAAIAREAGGELERLSAVNAGIKDLREVIARATERRKRGERTLLFVDEIHRWNKSQQDALLPHVEAGTIVLIGATTENPGHEINHALASRLKIYRLEALSDEAMGQLVDRALSDPERGLGGRGLSLSDEARKLLLLHSGGDARKALGGLEAASALAADGESIDAEVMSRALGRRQIPYDKDGDQHYDVASALIKSIRASDVDAALYWLARMEAGGEDPKFVARRLVIAASEDIGMARPGALAVANSVFDAVERVGPPECWINLAHGVAYLASCPKNWASYKAWRRAQKVVASRPAYPVPPHLRSANAVTRRLGDGQGYVHASEQGATRDFLPPELRDLRIYRPGRDGASDGA
jgi:putative ATPase